VDSFKYPVRLVPSIKKKLEVLDLRLFGDDMMSGRIGLGLFGLGYLTHGSHP